MLAFENASSFRLDVDLVTDTLTEFTITGMTKEGPFAFKFESATSDNIQNFTFNIPDVPIAISLAKTGSGFSNIAAHATVHLSINNTRILVLCQGIINQLYGISYPSAAELTTIQRNGLYVAVVGTDPAAGAELNKTIPDNRIIEVAAISFELTTDANAADRTVTVFIEGDSGFKVIRASTVTQQANEVITYSLIPGGTNQASVANDQTEIAIPAGIVLEADSVVRTVTTNRQAGDQFTNLRIFGRMEFLRRT